MKISQAVPVALVLAAVALVSGCNANSSTATDARNAAATVATTTTEAGATGTVTVSVPSLVPVTKLGPAPPMHRLEFGHIKSLVRSGDGFTMRFDPAEFTSGVTASDAALEDTGSSDVPNDNYVVDETHRLYTYLVPADAHVTVLGKGVQGMPIAVAQLAKLVKGHDPLGHPLFEPLETGFWMLYDVDTVRALDQQYQP
jgi:hypothetical protein